MPNLPKDGVQESEEEKNQEMEYKSITITKKINPCGHIHAIFLEDQDCFHKMFIKGPGTKCGEVWMDSLAKILTYALRRAEFEGTIEDGIIKQLLNVRCNNVVVNKDHICSCPDAIGKAIIQYLKIKAVEEVGKGIK